MASPGHWSLVLMMPDSKLKPWLPPHDPKLEKEVQQRSELRDRDHTTQQGHTASTHATSAPMALKTYFCFHRQPLGKSYAG